MGLESRLLGGGVGARGGVAVRRSVDLDHHSEPAAAEVDLLAKDVGFARSSPAGAAAIPAAQALLRPNAPKAGAIRTLGAFGREGLGHALRWRTPCDESRRECYASASEC